MLFRVELRVSSEARTEQAHLSSSALLCSYLNINTQKAEIHSVFTLCSKNGLKSINILCVLLFVLLCVLKIG